MYAAFALLLLAIGIEVAATVALPRTDGFRQPLWTSLVLSGYAASIWLLSIVIKHIPVSTAYAAWSGVGTAAVAVIAVLWLGEEWDWITVSALSMIVVGVVVLNMHGSH